MLAQTSPRVNEPPPPPLGDISTRRLVRLALMARDGNRLPAALRGRGADLESVQQELRRREVTGAGLRP